MESKFEIDLVCTEFLEMLAYREGGVHEPQGNPTSSPRTDDPTPFPWTGDPTPFPRHGDPTYLSPRRTGQ